MHADASILLQTITIALLAGIGAQLIAERLAIPSIVLLLLAGMVLGPDGLSWVRPHALGPGLEALVRLSMAIILFEGGLRLELRQMKTQQRVIIQLVAIGGLVTLIGAAAAARLILPLDGSKALLLGSMVIVTGPTVIGPLFKRVRVLRRTRVILESEGVLIDPVGMVVAFVVLELTLSDAPSLVLSVGDLLRRLATGALIGSGSGALLAFLLRRRLTTDIELINLGVLAIVLGTFVLADHALRESGLIAVVAAGTVMGNLTIPAKRELVQFKGLLTTLMISLLFVLLSAGIPWVGLARVEWLGLAWVAILMLLVRPMAVFISTMGTRTSLAEKLFLSWISPRGIVAASMASLFAIYLTEQGIAQGELLQALVFLTIIVTVLVQGLTAGVWARFLGLGERSFSVMIVGANPTGRLLGSLLRELGREVTLMDSNPRHCVLAHKEGLEAFLGNCLEREGLETAGVGDADTVVAVTPNSEVNYLVARLVLEEFRVPRALALVTESDKSVDETIRTSHRIEKPFGILLPDHIDDRIRSGTELWTARIGDGISGQLASLGLTAGVPLIHVHAGHAQVCGDLTPLASGDQIVFLGKPDDSRFKNLTRLSRAETGQPPSLSAAGPSHTPGSGSHS